MLNHTQNNGRVMGHHTPSAVSLAIYIALGAIIPSAVADESHIERIEVLGQINSGLLESKIDFEDSSSPDLRAQLSQLPGVSVNGNGLVSGIVQYRGLFGDRVKVKVDDIDIAGAGPNAMDSPLSHVLGTQQEVILYQGVAPVSVGAESLGGALVIRNNKPTLNTQDQWESTAALSATYFVNNEAKNVNAEVLSATDNAYVSVQGQLQRANNYESGSGDEVPSTFYDRTGFKLGAGYFTDDTAINALVAYRNTDESGTPALAMDIIYVDSLWYKLAVDREFDNNWQAKLKLYGNQNEHDMNNYELRSAPMPAMQRLNSVDSEAQGFDIDLIQFGQNGKTLRIEGGWRVGASYYQQVHNSRITNPNNAMFFIQNFNDIERDLLSAYLEYDGNFSLKEKKDMPWQIGFRASEVSLNADEVGSNMAMMNPNVAALVMGFNNAERELDYQLIDIVLKTQMPLTEQTDITFSLGQKERAPTYSEVYSWFPLGVSAGLADGRNYIGNLELKKESAKKVDIGIQYQEVGLSVMGSVFYQKIDDYIIGTPSTNSAANMIAMMMGAQGPLQWNNLGARIYGLDIYTSYEIDKHWQISTSAQWIDGNLTEAINGEKLPLYRIAPFSGNVNVSWQYDRIDATLSLVAAAKQDEVSSLQNERPTAGYGVLNFALDYELNEAMNLSLVIENLTDKFYAQHLGGVNRVANADIGVGEKVPEIGRNIGIHFDFVF
ncbi:TonB-dependent receptor [Glaciecola sp. MF2-115]|uniref:TonB-dependent receptor n=1 Tax=Glaciecola sp. MF2-115 TaxID=3384827 RepID=UPI00399F4CB0